MLIEGWFAGATMPQFHTLFGVTVFSGVYFFVSTPLPKYRNPPEPMKCVCPAPGDFAHTRSAVPSGLFSVNVLVVDATQVNVPLFAPRLNPVTRNFKPTYAFEPPPGNTP